jgi:phosphate starvation-inducible PhoH-like protein
VRKTIQVGGPQEVLRLFGPRDAYLKRLRNAFVVEVFARGSELRIDGAPDNVNRCQTALAAMQYELDSTGALSAESVEQIIQSNLVGSEGEAAAPAEGAPSDGGWPEPWPGVAAQTPGQAAYLHCLFESEVVFCIGPAGTGKTFLGVAVALNFLRRGKLQRIVLCRPAVEAEENLGFLPGDVFAKVDPYLRPLYDALHDLMDVRRVKRYIESDIIEILPLAFVRGRTLDNAFIILDEAQNCTVGQMKTFLTRLGKNARLLVTGDITQIDLPPERRSGLVDAQERLRNVPGIRFVWLGEEDIVRHDLVRRILSAYQREAAAPAGEEPPAPPESPPPPEAQEAEDAV